LTDSGTKKAFLLACREHLKQEFMQQVASPEDRLPLHKKEPLKEMDAISADMEAMKA
jgi:hypothetical protein